MKKLLIAFLLSACCVFAADFWSKPSSEWSDKDVQKMLTNSPWAHEYTLSLPPFNPGDFNGGGPTGGRGGGRGGPGGDPGGNAPPGSTNVQQMAPNIIVRWQSALPVKQAFVKVKYGEKAETSPDAKKLLEETDKDYVLVLSGNLRRLLFGPSAALRKPLMDATSLNVKGKDPVKPSELDIALEKDGNDIVFHFPRTAPFTAEDKEVEFDTKFGQVAVKIKFKPKEMVFNGKLEM